MKISEIVKARISNGFKHESTTKNLIWRASFKITIDIEVIIKVIQRDACSKKYEKIKRSRSRQFFSGYTLLSTKAGHCDFYFYGYVLKFWVYKNGFIQWVKNAHSLRACQYVNRAETRRYLNKEI